MLEVEWDDGRKHTLDLSGLISASKHFKAFADDPEAFSKVEVVNWGHGVAWENGLDYSAENLARLAEELDATPSPEDLRQFQERFGLTNEQAASALGYRVSQIKNFRAGKYALPLVVQVAIRAMQRDPAILHAAMAHSNEKRRKLRRKGAANA